MVTIPAEVAAGHHHGAAHGAALAAGRAAGGAAAAAHFLPTAARHPAARHQAGAALPALDASCDYMRSCPLAPNLLSGLPTSEQLCSPTKDCFTAAVFSPVRKACPGDNNAPDEKINQHLFTIDDQHDWK